MDGWPETKWPWRAGYDYATAKYKAEIERLRAENERLRALLASKADKASVEPSQIGELYQ